MTFWKHAKTTTFSALTWMILCFVSGALAALAMAPTNFWFVLFPTLSLLYLGLARGQNARQCFIRGWLFGFGYFLAGLYWIGNALLIDGNDYAWAWPLAVMGLPFALAFFPGLACLAIFFGSNLKKVSGFLFFAAVMAFSEWLRGHIFTGFPWNLYGYAWADVLPIIQTVAIGDIYFLTWLTILWASLPGFLIFVEKPQRAHILLSAILIASFAGCYGFGFWRLSTQPTQFRDDVNIRIVQASIPQIDKWDPNAAINHLYAHLDLSVPGDEPPAKSTLIIWPETAISTRTLQNPIAFRAVLDVLRSYPGHAYLLAGTLQFDQTRDAYLNSLPLIDKNGTVSNIYNKHHLVPFGEYIPFQKLIPLEPVTQFSGFAQGPGPQIFSTPEDLRYSPAICYEIIFPGTLVPEDAAPDLIVNVTNDGWYGNSPGPYQHFTQARFRAVEQGIPVVRAANTGISGLIDPLGQVIDQSTLFQKYEKTLALPAPNMVFRKKAKIGTLFFMGIASMFILAGPILKT